MSTPQKAPCVAAFGEILLRLKAPGHERLLQSAELEATFGGAEANVLASLAADGVSTRMITVLPTNPLGDAAMSDLRQYGVDMSRVLRAEGRLGTYYLEAGAGARASRVLYDRAHSAFASAASDSIDWTVALDGASWLHLSGITPALGESSAALTIAAAQRAKSMGLTVSCDYNHRASLWSADRGPVPVMEALMPYVDIGIAGRSDCQVMLGIDAPMATTDEDAWFRALGERVLSAFPSLRMQVITRRDGDSAGRYGWSACAVDRDGFHVSRRYAIDEVVDRVGAGDAFSAGLLYAMLDGRDHASALEFATAASCLKHSIPGDVNRARAAEVDALLAGHGGGRIQR